MAYITWCSGGNAG